MIQSVDVAIFSEAFVAEEVKESVGVVQHLLRGGFSVQAGGHRFFTGMCRRLLREHPELRLYTFGDSWTKVRFTRFRALIHIGSDWFLPEFNMLLGLDGFILKEPHSKNYCCFRKGSALCTEHMRRIEECGSWFWEYNDSALAMVAEYLEGG